MIDTKQLIKAGEEKMTFAIEYLDEQLSHIRAGKANPKILDCVKVMYYGAPVPLTNVATVTVPDARTIDRKSTRLNSSHTDSSRMPSSA